MLNAEMFEEWKSVDSSWIFVMIEKKYYKIKSVFAPFAKCITYMSEWDIVNIKSIIQYPVKADALHYSKEQEER